MQRPVALKTEAAASHARAGSSSGITELSVNRQGGQELSDLAAHREEHAVLPSSSAPPDSGQTSPGLLRQAIHQGRRKMPSASGFVTLGFATLLLYLTVARKCNDGSWPAACSALHFHSDVTWVSYRKTGSRDPMRCNEAISVPRVALMFLSAQGLHHEDSWRDWLKDAGGLVPKERIKEHGCGERELERLGGMCNMRYDAAPLDRQFLFSVYTHPSASYKGHPKGSIFHGREVPLRAPAAKGRPVLVDAIKALLTAALATPHNSQFVLLSESDIPLYPAGVVWRQLQGEAKSRINACPLGNVIDDGYPETASGDSLMQRRYWRKSAVWMGLRRKHAELALQDNKYLASMRQHCQPGASPNSKGGPCYLDEHYIPSLLAIHGVANETDCHGGLVTADWSRVGASHPREYSPNDITPALMKRLRADVLFGTRLDWRGCNSKEAIRRGLQSFARMEDVTPRSCRSESRWSKRSLKYQCPLFARKFRNNTARAVHDALIDCEAGLGILDLGEGCS